MTMGTTYSPAPWKEEETEDGDVFVVMDEGHKVFIGNLEDTCGVCHANARLIKAAPELFSEMRRYFPILEKAEQDPELWNRLTQGTGIATLNGYRAAIKSVEL